MPIMEFPAMAIIAVCYFLSPRRFELVPTILLILWEMHYVHRTLIFPFLKRGTKRHFPIVLIFFAVMFNAANGYLNGRFLFFMANVYSPSWLTDPRFIAGSVIFVTAFIGNLYSDAKLRNLRKPGETGYKIPYGGLFTYISCPNYFTEIMEWVGWTIATWSLAGLAFAVFTTANLLPRAHSHHAWYLKQFPEYPKNRKRLIPFLY